MKALIAVLVVLLLAVGGVGGYYIYQRMTIPAQGEELLLEEEKNDPKKASNRALTRMRTPKNDADVLDLLSYAYSKNPDTVAWLRIPGTEINNVVLQGDDNYTYERRNEDGEEDIYGCYFLDAECGLGAREHFSQNTVIYGHSDLKDNADGPRFSQLFRFVDPAFAKETPYIDLITSEGIYSFEIFSVFYTDVRFNYIQVAFGDAQKLEMAQKAQALSLHDYGITLTAEDRLLTLSTCSVKDGNDGNHRFVVMARLRPEGAGLETNKTESEQAGTEAAESASAESLETSGK